jgi:hypothetical protein
MALAHTSARNYIVGISMFVLVTLCINVLSEPQPTAEQFALDLIKNPKILEILRGPKGDVGPVGPAGPPGVAGSVGPAGPPGVVSPQRPNTDNLSGNLSKKSTKNRAFYPDRPR